MNKVRNSLKEALESNPVTASLLSVGVIFLMINPILSLLAEFTYIGFYYSFYGLIYRLYLFGIILSFAAGADLALTIAFGILAAVCLKSSMNYTNFNTFVNLVFYVCLTLFSFRNRKLNLTDKQSQTGTEKKRFCPECGKPLRSEAIFCPACGKECPVPSLISGRTQTAAASYSGSGKEVVMLCGSTMVLIFNILLSLDLLYNTFGRFSFITLLVHTPMIIICIGSWMVYAGCVSGKPKTSGFTVINTVLMLQQILATIPWGIGMLVGLLLVFAGDTASAVGFLVMLITGVALCFVTAYWNGMRRAALQAKKLLMGEETEWSSSLLVIILTIMSILKQVWVLFVQSGTNGTLGWIVNEIAQAVYDATGSYSIYSYAYQYLASVFGIENFGSSQMLAGALSISVPVCAVIILIMIRNHEKSI